MWKKYFSQKSQVNWCLKGHFFFFFFFFFFYTEEYFFRSGEHLTNSVIPVASSIVIQLPAFVLLKWAPSSESVSSSIPSWQILTAHAQPFRGARDLAFCLKVPLESLLVWASSGGSGETAGMRRLAWTFAARIGDTYQIRLTRPKLYHQNTLRSKIKQICLDSLQQCNTSPIYLYIYFAVLRPSQQYCSHIELPPKNRWEK